MEKKLSDDIQAVQTQGIKYDLVSTEDMDQYYPDVIARYGIWANYYSDGHGMFTVLMVAFGTLLIRQTTEAECKGARALKEQAEAEGHNV